MYNSIIDMTGNSLDKFLNNYKERYLKFIWEYENLEIVGRFIERMESNYNSEIEKLEIFKGKNEIFYDSYCYEVINNIENNKIFKINNKPLIEISIYDYPDKILNLNNSIVWDSSEIELKYKKIIDEIRRYKKDIENKGNK